MAEFVLKYADPRGEIRQAVAEAGNEAELRDRLWKGLSENIEAIYLNGSMEHRLPNNLNVRLDGIEGESMILMLDMEGICVSSGSACTIAGPEAFFVKTTLGLWARRLKNSLNTGSFAISTPSAAAAAAVPAALAVPVAAAVVVSVCAPPAAG